MYISSTSNEKLKFLNSLKKKSVRDEEGLLLLEGERLIYDSEKWGAEIVSVYYKEGYEGRKILCQDEYTLSQKAFDKISETVNSQGIIAVAKKKKGSIKGKELLVLADGVRDPGNMGTIIRLCHASGAGLILGKECTDPYSPKCVRSSMGGIFSAECEVFSDELYEYLKDNGYKFYGGILGDDTKSLFETDFCEKCVLVVGNEGDGISPKMQNLCDNKILIPMPGGAESLNVATAASVMVYEYLRQRGWK